jgi:outer membrane protein TolC
MKHHLLGAALLLGVSAPLGCQSTEIGRKPAMLATTSARLPTSQCPCARALLLPPIDAISSVTSSATDDGPVPEQAVYEPGYVPAVSGGQVIDLEYALILASGKNPTIGLGLVEVEASQARLTQARSLLLPTLRAGASTDWHQGTVQSSQGIIRDVEYSSVYAGGGALAVGAGTVGYPAVSIVAPLGDAILEPTAARQALAGRQFDATATRNSILLDTATAYFALAGAEARWEANRQSGLEFGEMATLTANFAKAGQGKEADANRARSEVLLIRAASEQIEGEIAAASAELARLLDIDPRANLRAAHGPIPMLQLIAPSATLESLIQTAVANRPEIGARSADVEEARTRLRQEQIRPLLPVVAVGFSAGDFGGGGNQVQPAFGPLAGRTDVDVSAYWTLQNFGFGNLARQRQRQAQVRQANAQRARVIDEIRTEVADAFALVGARRNEIEVARRRIDTANRSFTQEMKLARNLEVRPIEVLDSAKLLLEARQDFIAALVGFNQAQVQLFVAIGEPPGIQR